MIFRINKGQVILICLACFCFSGVPGLKAQEKFFTNYSLIHTKIGERLIGPIVDQNEDQVVIENIHSHKNHIYRKEIKNIYPSGSKIMMRNDGKFAFINYFGMDIRNTFTGYGNQFYIDYNFYFLDNFRIGMLAGDHSERTDALPYTMFGYSFRYVHPSSKRRPYVSLSYTTNIDIEGDDDKIRIVNLGYGLDLLNRKKVKFDIAAGVSGRSRYTQDITIDRAGNPVEFERNTYAISAYFEFGIKFRLTSFDW